MATQFTSGTSPQQGGGQVFVENANGEWEIANVTSPGVVRQVFTSSDTYTPSPGMIFADVIIVGGGAGGAGADSTSTTNAAASSGGGAAGWVRHSYSAAEIGASAAIVIGGGGSGGSGAANGNNGANSTFTPTGSGATLTAGAGLAGQDSTTADGFLGIRGGYGGTAAGGDENYPGSQAATAYSFGDNIQSTHMGVASDGASTPFGQGGIGAYIRGSSGQASAGGNASGYGCGGGGGASIHNAAAANGGNGSGGICVVTEYIRQSVLSPIVYDANGNELLDLSETVTNAVNYTIIGNGATSDAPFIEAAGDDTNIDLALYSKGTGVITLDGFQSGVAKVDGGNLTAASALEIALDTFGSDFEFYTIRYWFHPQTDAQDVLIRVSTNGGASFDNGGSDYAYARLDGDESESITGLTHGSTGAESYILAAASVGADADQWISGEIRIHNPQSSTYFPMISFESWHMDEITDAKWSSGCGRRTTAQDTTDIQIGFSSGNISQGHWALYGHYS